MKGQIQSKTDKYRKSSPLSIFYLFWTPLPSSNYSSLINDSLY